MCSLLSLQSLNCIILILINDYGINIIMMLSSNMDIRGLGHWAFMGALVCPP